MPEMELFGPERPKSLNELFAPESAFMRSGIWRRLLAYAHWPADERQRRAFIVRPYLEALASIDKKYDGDPDYAAAHFFVYEEFRSCGGWTAAEAKYEESLEKNFPALHTAAAILHIIRTIPNDMGSLNKAIHTIEKTASNYKFIRNRTDIIKAWNSHRGVAHLGVALIHVKEFCEPEDFSDSGRLRDFFIVARDYEIFATSYKPPRQREPLLDTSRAWKLPADFHSLPRLGRLPRLPEDMIAASKSYRAPIPSV